MARGPDGAVLPPDDGSGEELNRLERELTLGLEKVIDGVLNGHRPGDPFVYGIHQSLSPRMIDALVARYRAAGWDEVRLTPGLTGTCMLVLRARRA